MNVPPPTASDTGVRPPNPYVGPRSIRYGEKIYGRDAEIERLRDVFIAERIVLFYSPSGAGKTSLIEAGLRPELERREFWVLPTVRVGIDASGVLTNGGETNRYVLSTLLSLEEGRPKERQLPPEQLMTTRLADYLDLLTEDERELDPCLVFDQFEELFTSDPTDLDAKEAFMDELGLALRNRGMWALVSMREDFVPQLDPYLRSVPTRLRTRFRLDLLTAEAAIIAARRPAEAVGVHFSRDAAERLVDDLRRVRVRRGDAITQELGPYVEPVQLQVVCRQLWDTLNL